MPPAIPLSSATPARRRAVNVAPTAAASAARSGASGRPARSIATAFVAAPRKALKDMTARERFSTLQDRFNASAAKGVDVRFQFVLSGSGGGSWYVQIKDGKLTVKEGTGPNPTATMRASAEDYLKIANGQMNKMFAFIRGKLKVDGDKDELKKFDSYFTS